MIEFNWVGPDENLAKSTLALTQIWQYWAELVATKI